MSLSLRSLDAPTFRGPSSTTTRRLGPRLSTHWPTLTGSTRNSACAPAAQQAVWRERALNAEDALNAAHAEITRQRTRIGELLGQIRDLQAEWDDETIARITTENTSLKQRIRQLTVDNRTFEERLSAARSTLRFQDRRLADLESRIADPTTMP